MGSFANKLKDVGSSVEDGALSVQQVIPKHILVRGGFCQSGNAVEILRLVVTFVALSLNIWLGVKEWQLAS